MQATELLYSLPSALIAAALFVLILISIRMGTAAGRRFKSELNEQSRKQAIAVQGSLLGLLALLLGFTFSLALSRYDDRSAKVIAEANAIGTAWLRTDLVGNDRREEAKDLLRRYATVRLETSLLSTIQSADRLELSAEAEAAFAELWALAAEEAREAGSPVAMGFAGSLNDMIDALALRNAAVNRHVPELVLFLLFGTFLILGGVIGYSNELSNIRSGVPTYAVVTLIVILVFLIIDLDRPRRGLITVDQSSLRSVVAAMTPP